MDYRLGRRKGATGRVMSGSPLLCMPRRTHRCFSVWKKTDWSNPGKVVSCDGWGMGVAMEGRQSWVVKAGI